MTWRDLDYDWQASPAVPRGRIAVPRGGEDDRAGKDDRYVMVRLKGLPDGAQMMRVRRHAERAVLINPVDRDQLSGGGPLTDAPKLQVKKVSVADRARSVSKVELALLGVTFLAGLLAAFSAGLSAGHADERRAKDTLSDFRLVRADVDDLAGEPARLERATGSIRRAIATAGQGARVSTRRTVRRIEELSRSVLDAEERHARAAQRDVRAWQADLRKRAAKADSDLAKSLDLLSKIFAGLAAALALWVGGRKLLPAALT